MSELNRHMRGAAARRAWPWQAILLGIAAAAMLLLTAACTSDDSGDDNAAANGAASAASNGGGASATGASIAQTAATATAAADPRADWPTVFRVGIFGGDDAEEALENVQPFADKLTAELGVEVEVFTGTSYNAVIEAMRADRVDAMEVGPFSYILAVQEADAEALGVGVSCPSSQEVCSYNPELPAHYISVVFTKKGNDAGITSIEDLPGHGFNFVDPASTSGHLAPKTLLIQRGLDPDTDMTTVFAGSHPTSVLSVWNDKADAGATNEGNILRLVTEGQIQACLWADGVINRPRTPEEIQATFDACPDGHIAILAQTDPIPSTPFAIRQELPESFKAEVKQLLLGLKDDPAFVEERRRWYVDPSVDLGLERLDHYYNALRDIAQLLDLDLQELE